MGKFCLVINQAAGSKRKLKEDHLLRAMASVMYRLLHMSFALGSMNEAVRLGLLAFSYQTFLQPPNVRTRQTSLIDTYRDCLLNIAVAGNDHTEMMLWLQMVGAVAVFSAPDNTWLRPMLQSSIYRCKLGSWSELATLLKSFLWIDFVHDKPGRDIFDGVMLR